MPWGKDIPPSLRPEGPRETSRGLSGRHDFYPPLPRASACGLSPGLRSPGPLGRRSKTNLADEIRATESGIALDSVGTGDQSATRSVVNLEVAGAVVLLTLAFLVCDALQLRV